MIKNTGFMETQDSNYTRYIIESSLDPLITINVAGMITTVNDNRLNTNKTAKEERSKAEKAMQEIHLFLSKMSSEIKKPLSGRKVRSTFPLDF